MKKLIVVVNGKGGAGKDTLCRSLEGTLRVVNVSSIDPIKKIARSFGWNGEKDARSRRFLAELKQAFVNYCDLPTVYLKAKTEEFLSGDGEVMFVHIREGDQIDAFRRAIAPQPCVTLLVKRRAVDFAEAYGNAADDEVDNYDYDVVFHNDRPIARSAEDFKELIEALLGE